MSIFYTSERVGKGGKVFKLYKFRTLKEEPYSLFPIYSKNPYTRFGKFLRKTHLDELPQLWNIIKRDMSLVGPRPEELRTYEILPKETRRILELVRPGLTSLASLHFFDEGKILEQSENVQKDYWTKIKPSKILLDVFYVEHKSFALDAAILWLTFRKVIHSLFR